MAQYIPRSLAIVALLLGEALAQSNTTVDANTGHKMVGWVSPAPRRSTWSIIWSCLSIFIVCSWKCVHLNIPSHEEIQAGWHTFDVFTFFQDVPYWPKWPLLRKWSRKVLWMVFIAVAPEFGVALAVKQYTEARKELNRFAKLKPRTTLHKYTMAYAFYVQMGGIVVYNMPEGPVNSANLDPNRNYEPRDASVLPHNLVINPQSAVEQPDRDTQGSNRSTSIPKGRIITSLAILDEYPVIHKITEHEIKDLSKADAITKAFAIIQCTWLVLQSIVRGVQGYSISQLELAALAFIFCALMMHLFWWYKPFDVETRRVLPMLPLQGIKLANLSSLSMDDLTILNRGLLKERVEDFSIKILGELLTNAIITSTSQYSSTASVLPSIGLYITAIGFSAIHLAAWNWDFPSSVARSLWRWFNVSALAASVLPPILAFIYIYLAKLEDFFLKLLFLSFLSYVVSRMVVLGLTFYCLSSMPETAYSTVSWLAWIPHFS